MTEWLLKFGFGGVQDFIAHSRMTRDLFGGSRIISILAERAGNSAMERGATLVLPGSDSRRTNRWPHQIVALIQGDEPRVKDAGTAMSDAARSWWTGSWSAILKRNSTWMQPIDDEAAIAAQLDAAIECYWVALPRTGPLEGYEAAYAAIAQAFEDRRWTRTFKSAVPLSSDAHLACSLCGQRESILRPWGKKRWQRGRRFTGSSEALCAVCVTRRFATLDLDDVKLTDVPSTHRLARRRVLTDPVVLRFARSIGGDGVRVIEHLLDLGWVGTGGPVALEPPNGEVADGTLNASSSGGSPDASSSEFEARLRGALADLSKPGWNDAAARLAEGSSPYFAILAFDGDAMGRWMSGEYLASSRRGDDPLREAQGRLSSSLARFADAADASIRGCGAFTVYLGGDDGLALVPLDSLLRLAVDLQEQWQSQVVAAFAPLAGSGRVPTLSLHASVVHLAEPLQPALEGVRRTLSDSKGLAGSDENDRGDCVSLLVAPRSGTESHVLLKWSELAGYVTLVELLGSWRRGDFQEPTSVELRIRDGVAAPGRLPQTLLDECKAFFVPTGMNRGALSMRDALAREIARLSGRGATPNATATIVRDFLLDRARRRRFKSPADTLTGWRCFSGTLESAAFLARALTWPAAATHVHEQPRHPMAAEPIASSQKKQGGSR